MARKESAPERVCIVTIRSEGEKNNVSFACWRYWEIVGELIWRKADRLEAYEAARWCARARPTDRLEIDPGISMEVR